jgi:GNAT superfamily N-acetyltransferase
MNLLRQVDYLSTVSGGGYIGGFWSAWLARGDPYGGPPASLFPASDRDPLGSDTSGHQVSDTPEIRHLREFSRFLSPRLGFFETEMWHAVVAFLAGLIPALLATLALLACGLIGWARIGAWVSTSAGTALLGTVGLVAAGLVVFERASDRTAFPETRVAGRWWYVIFSLAALAAVAWTRTWLEAWLAMDRAGVPPWPDAWLGPDGSTVVFIYPPLMIVALASFMSAGFALPIWLVARAMQTSAKPGGDVARAAIAAVGALERVVMRLLGLSIVWALVVVLWHLGINLSRVHIRATWAGMTALASGGIFGLIRNWLNQGFKNTGTQGLVERLRPVLPQVLAYLTIGCAMVWLISLMADWLGRSGESWDRTALVMLAGLAVYAFLDPAAYSLHAFYRDRIARAYLGATSPRGSQRGGANRSTEPRPADDMPLDRTLARPLHLVCCTANDLSGDQIETLTRGARSATLSRFGIAIGDRFAGPPEITFASALTASAAAFNPVMGSRSTQFGPAVTFVLAALNLRLGCWVRHPASRAGRRPVLPGLRFFKELFGMTNAGVNGAGRPYAPDVHLSDGGHFENLGLYELVRRHCRYIIVSDCGADPTVAFDDLGNAVRRIREDFGVEIELDLAPLQMARPVTERQHAVVGTIHYDRHFDKGVLVYFKPTLNGNEPPDVGQYHTRNTEFPHEATSDQFYDEAQWESYRRLGFHSVQECFRFVERRGGTLRRDQIFTGARLEWYPTPEGLPARSLELTDRFAALERELLAAGPLELLAQLFPELPPPNPAGVVAVQPGSVEAARLELATMTALLRAMQVMEDVWQACDLDTEWRHPLNVGWVNAFARWATASAFVDWWPILAPNFHPGFQRFIREQFYPRAELQRSLGRVMVSPPGSPQDDDLPAGLAAQWWLDRMRLQPKRQGRPVYEYRLAAKGSRPELQVALIMVSTDALDPTVVSWTNEDLFVPPSLWGAGIGSEFLPAILDELAGEGVSYCDVHIVSRPDEKDAAHRQERIAFTEFYRSQGFRTLSQQPTMPKMVRELHEVDSWVTLRCALPRAR